MSTTTIKYDAAKSQSTAATVADFVRTNESELHDAPLTSIPGIGEVTAELFDDLATAQELITKFRRFNRANRNHDEVAQRFFKWLREEIGGSFNKHTVTEAVENWVLEHVAADASSSDEEINYDPSKSGPGDKLRPVKIRNVRVSCHRLLSHENVRPSQQGADNSSWHWQCLCRAL